MRRLGSVRYRTAHLGCMDTTSPVDPREATLPPLTGPTEAAESRLITAQIATKRHGLAPRTVKAHMATGLFPSPVARLDVPGSTGRCPFLFRATDVAAYAAARGTRSQH